MQCREGCHLEQEPVIEPDNPTDEQSWLIQTRAGAQAARDADEVRGEDMRGLYVGADDVNRTRTVSLGTGLSCPGDLGDQDRLPQTSTHQ